MRAAPGWAVGGCPARTRSLAQELRSASASDAAYAQTVLDLFRRERFHYTLTPPRLAQDAVDEFLFETRRGFCEHYASAFAVLMRAAGVPARVVIGYQGGTFNRYGGYWIIRQSDAHAWDEIWLEGRGWVRVDPTAAIAPERIERGSADVLDAGLIGAAQKVEHYEIAAYGTARAHAEQLGLGQVAGLLQQTLDEEAAANEKLTAIAERQVNRQAENMGLDGGRGPRR